MENSKENQEPKYLKLLSIKFKNISETTIQIFMENIHFLIMF